MSGHVNFLDGRCLCGAVHIRISGAYDPRVGACHCRMCQRWSGGVFLEFTAPATAVTVTGEVARYQSTSFAERAFCPRCGSHLWFRDTDVPDTDFELVPGLFDAARDWPLRSEIYIDRAMTSARLAGEHPRKTRAEYEASHAHIEGDLP